MTNEPLSYIFFNLPNSFHVRQIGRTYLLWFSREIKKNMSFHNIFNEITIYFWSTTKYQQIYNCCNFLNIFKNKPH